MSEREQRYEELFNACYQPLHAFARRRLPQAEAEDLVAEVLTTAWRRLDDVPHDATLPWLYGVAHRTLANQRRSSDRRRRLLRRIALSQPVAAAATSESHPILDALERLERKDRDILRLAAWEGLTAREIAVVLECTPNAAALRLSRARQKLRAELSPLEATPTRQHGRVTDA